MSNEEENRNTLKKLKDKYPHVKLLINKTHDLILECQGTTFTDLNLMMEPPLFLRLVKDFVRLMGLHNLS